jgi:hypothetical protein
VETWAAQLRELRLVIEVTLPDTVDQLLVGASASFGLESIAPLLFDPSQESSLSSLCVLEDCFGWLR